MVDDSFSAASTLGVGRIDEDDFAPRSRIHARRARGPAVDFLLSDDAASRSRPRGIDERGSDRGHPGDETSRAAVRLKLGERESSDGAVVGVP